VLHGAGSSAAVAHRLIPPTLFPASATTYITDPDSRLAHMRNALDDWHCSTGQRGRRFVAGVSLGAHAVALWLSTNPESVDAALLIMPAWTGPPDHSASLTSAAARLLHLNGVENELRRLQATAPPERSWVVQALHTTWSSQPHHRIVAGMQSAAHQFAPSREELSRISVPTLVVGLREDPFHPLATARTWSEAIPYARYVDVSDQEIAEAGNFATSRVTHIWRDLVQTDR
jgi:pimeloyl-ACP methyl ester carboxylesterase